MRPSPRGAARRPSRPRGRSSAASGRAGCRSASTPGGCWDSRKRCTPISTDQARRALAEGIPACPHCRPETALGMQE
ncbi:MULTISPECIES: DUF6233 domain-containing protein [unclassified Streptomyces]|uniref:DUF6233 domain-containing protein n=1 Tax=unclassified Streptomyces TaxID=2593676 RepID=UPI00332A2A91